MYRRGGFCSNSGGVARAGFRGGWGFKGNNQGAFPPVETVPAASRKTSANYKGPIPREWVDYWHSQLTPDRREWLYKERLLSDLTIDSKLIGWRPDYKAYVVPFWAGIPRYSEVVSLQYRSTPESPPVSGPNWHYTGHTGHNKPCIIGAHLINSDYMIGLIGTFDQLLAEQDGLPVFSPNGASVFGNHTRLESIELQRMFMDVRCKVVIPDTTPTEHIHAQGLAELIGGRVSYFPRDFGGKDYTDFRKLGFTPEDFVKMVLRDEQGFMYMLESNQVENCRLILQALSEGDPETSFEIMKVVAEASRYVFDPATIRPRISHTLQMLSIQALYPGFNPQEWSQIADEFSQTISFPEMAGVLKRWGEVASVRRGGF